MLSAPRFILIISPSVNDGKLPTTSTLTNQDHSMPFCGRSVEPRTSLLKDHLSSIHLPSITSRVVALNVFRLLYH